MGWKFDQNKPMFLQIASRIRNDIILGVYKPDEQLPSVRQIASEAAVNPNTVQRAILMLQEEKLLYPRTTVGLFVTSDTAAIEAAKVEIKRTTAKKLIKEALAVGITADELIGFIKEETTSE